MIKQVTPRKEAETGVLISSSHNNNQPCTSSHVTPRKEANTSVANHLLDISDFYDASVVNSLLDEPFEIDGTKLRTDRNYYGFDNNTGDNYIYPTNLQKRDYQYNISKQALFKNTLVVLPTGLGKTFIAAVVMYNFFRWYPRGKIIFMAPTRPLVAQQVEACYKIMGIPPDDTVEMTGQRAKKFRSEIWRTKRVFYATPQLVQSDIASPDIDFPFSDIKLVVVDEAHKAQGKYAYTEVIQAIHSRNPLFRILALSATPGRHIDDVCHVVKNLLISHIEIRWETSIDVSQYTFRKNIRTLVIPLGPHLTKIKDEFIQLMDPYVRYLLDQQVCSGSLTTLSKGWVIMEQKKFREEAIHHRHPQHSTIMEYFSTCVSLYHALECLERHGLRVFVNYFDSDDGMEKYFVQKDRGLKAFLENLRTELGPNPFAINDATLLNGAVQEIPKDLDFGHPKYEILRKHLCQHFEKNKETRVIVFCEYRESVHLVYRLLLQHRPLIKAKVFVGKGNSSLGLRALSQKEQMQVMNDFRAGICNTLVGTCVIEEGIDVCDVDLIVTFDISSKNPTRFVQRMGRTGRKRHGHVLLLATEGKEHKMVKEVLASKDKTNQKLSKSSEILRALYKSAPRLVPPEFNPVCLETYIKVDQKPVLADSKKKKPTKADKRSNNEVSTSTAVDVPDEDEALETEPAAKKKKTTSKKTKKAPVGVQDVRKFFNRAAAVELDEPQPMILDAEALETSDVASDTSTHSRVNKSVRNQELDVQWRKLKNIYTKFSRNENPSEDLIGTPNISQLMANDDISNNVKKQLLTSNIDFVKDRIDAAKALEALHQGNTDSDDVVILEDGVEKVRKDVEEIKTIFGGITFVQKFLDEEKSLRQQKKKISSSTPQNKLENLFLQMKQQPADERITETTMQSLKNSFNQLKSRMEKYDKLTVTDIIISQPIHLQTAIAEEHVEQQQQPQPNHDNCAMDVEIEKTTVVDVVKDCDSSLLFVQTQYQLPEFIWCESKYSDQLPADTQSYTNPQFSPVHAKPTTSNKYEFKTPNRIPSATKNNIASSENSHNRDSLLIKNQSHKTITSPLLATTTTTTSTPKRLANLNFKTPSPKLSPLTSNKLFVKSPLLEAFRRTIEKTTPKKTATAALPTSSGTLKYFLLDTIEDLFTEYDEGDAARSSSSSNNNNNNKQNNIDDVSIIQIGSLSSTSLTADDVNEYNGKNNTIDSKSDRIISAGKDNNKENKSVRENVIANLNKFNYIESMSSGGADDDVVVATVPLCSVDDVNVGKSENVGEHWKSVRQDVEDEIKTNTTNATNNYEDFLMKKSLIMPPYILNNNEKNDFNRNDEYGIDVGVCDDKVVAVTCNEKISNSNKKMMIGKSVDNESVYTITQIMERLEDSTSVTNSLSDTQKNLELGEVDDIFGSDDDLFAEVPSSSSSSGKENKVVDAQTPQSSRCLKSASNEVNKSPSIFCVKARRSIHHQHTVTSPAVLDDTIRGVPLNNRRAIHSDSSDNEIVTDDDAAFVTCQTSSKSAKKSVPAKAPFSRKRADRLKKRSSFLLSQAVQSGDEENEDEEDCENGFIENLIASSDDSDTDEHNNTNMRAKYLESIRSPILQRNGAFKIPELPRLPPITANIFSQFVEPDVSSYKDLGDSFVVSEEEDDDDACVVSSQNEPDELDVAEAILRAARRRKMKRTRILRQFNDSSDEEMEKALKKSKVEF